jgi:F-type H+-transporting ATPase subunit gamma
MPSLKIIRKRIVSVKSTEKTTKAMKMVAGARLNRAQQAITALRPYAVKTGEILRSVAAQKEGDGATDEGASLHPYLARRPEENVLIVLFSGDRGLCGGFNTNVNKAAERLWQELKTANKKVTFLTVGRKGKEYVNRRKGTIAEDFAKPYDGLDLGKARGIANAIASRFRAREVDSVYFVFNEFKSAMTQKPNVQQLLPLPPLSGEESAPAKEQKDSGGATEFLFEPDKKTLIHGLVPMYVEITVFRAMLETQAGFFGAQMTAMDSASRNAKDMIKRLSLAYNRARQAAITKELMEIIGGAEALKE